MSRSDLSYDEPRDRREPIFKDDANRQRFVEQLAFVSADPEQATRVVARGPVLGQMSERLGPEHYGEERRESQVEKAERVVGEELRRRRWTEATLRERTKGGLGKLKIAVRLRNETLVTVAWIAERLQMGSVVNVNTLLYQ